MFRTISVFLFVAALAALASSSALAGTPGSYTQPVVGTSYAVTSNPGGCVKVGDSYQVVNVLKNMTTKVKYVDVYVYGIGIADPMAQKGGPLIDVDTAASGLAPTTDPTIWHWFIKLTPDASVTKTLFVNTVPPGYYPSNWNPAYGAMPWPTLYLGGQAYVKNSRTQFGLYAQTPYCSLDGSVPYTISPPPDGTPGK